MQLSLVICTRNRAPQLAESLQSLTRLQCQLPWELVVVDNGSTDETQVWDNAAAVVENNRSGSAEALSSLFVPLQRSFIQSEPGDPWLKRIHPTLRII
jgi:glycosyltransferase involved in cell wall biosynthesis